MSKSIRLAIIGSGNIAQVHAAAISEIPQVQLVAVCSRNRAKAESLIGTSGAQIFPTVRELLEGSEIDGVLIATPSGLHAESAIPAMRAGKHVLCEKPLEISTNRVNHMLAEAEQAGVILGGFFPLRCGAGARAIKRTALAGRFGQLTFLSARIKWWRDQKYYSDSDWRGTWELDGGGALMNQGIHAVDLLQWIGGAPREVSAFASTLAHQTLEVEDTLTAAIRFEDGCLGSISAATSCYPGLDLCLEVSGTKGTAILVNDQISFWQFSPEADEDETIRTACAGEIRGGTFDPRAISHHGHREQIEDFCKAILGEPTDLIGGQEAGIVVSIVEAIYRSTLSRKIEIVSQQS